MDVRHLIAALAMTALLVSCGSSPETPAAEATGDDVAPTVAPEPPAPTEPDGVEPAAMFGDEFPEVLAVTTMLIDGEDWRFNVTLSSTYDTPERYADAWRVLDESDTELGIRVLGHDHANEQPFTRSHTIQVPSGTASVWVEGRDQANGWSGQRYEVVLP